VQPDEDWSTTFNYLRWVSTEAQKNATAKENCQRTLLCHIGFKERSWRGNENIFWEEP
jgi:hypothetical protein